MQIKRWLVESRAVSPLEKYNARLGEGQFQEDAAQAQVMALLDELYFRLSEVKTHEGIWQRFRSRLVSSTPDPLQGLYIWGGVGRGKTMMMDMFYDALPPERRLRMHFHRFMKRVHDGLKKHAGSVNPLVLVAGEFADETNVLCFDEFFVSDIGDAMILAELLQALFARGVTLVATSNVEPANLYANGLQRRRFLPAIDLLYTHSLVHHMPDGIDFRLRALEQAEIYHSPLDTAAEESLAKSFASLAPESPQEQVNLTIEGRDIPVVKVADDVAWFEFAALCDGPRSQNDYIELAMIYHAVVLSNVPTLDASSENAARRFISLVDEFYDHGVKLIISAAAPILELYQGEKLRFEFERTQSRLLEMQSHEYLSRSHMAAHSVEQDAVGQDAREN